MNPKFLQPDPIELAEALDPDYERYLFVIRHGEPYDLDACLWCGADTMGDCYCADVGRCLICSAWAEISDGVCHECRGAMEKHLPKFELELEWRMADLGLL